MSDLYLDTLDCMTVKQLRSRLVYYGMPHTGKKEELKKRLLDMFQRSQRKSNDAADQQSRGDAEPQRQAPSKSSSQQLNRASEADESNLRLRTARGDKSSENSKTKLKAKLRRQLEELEESSVDNSTDADSENDDQREPRGTSRQTSYQSYRHSTEFAGYGGARSSTHPTPDRPVVYDERLVFEKLPAPTPPIFDGDVLMYSDWKVAFDGLIDHLPLRPCQKFYYLKQYLAGKALRAVSSYFMRNTDRAYEEARKLLDHRFGDPFLLSREVQFKLKSWPRIGGRDAEGLRDFSDFLGTCLTMKEDYCSLTKLDDITEILELTQKLPDWCANKWNDKAYSYKEKHHDYPKFKKFVEYLRRESDKACDSVYSMGALKKMEQTSRPESRRTKPEKAMTKRTATTTTKESQPEQKTKTEDARQCSYCKGKHKLPECRKFTQIGLEERQRFVQDNRLCYGCLVENHLSKNCKRREICTICSRKHPTVLHREAFKPSDTTEQQSSQSKAHTVEARSVSNFVTTKKFSSMVVPVFVSSKRNPKTEVLTYALLDTQSDTTFALSDVLDQLPAKYENTQLKLSTMTSKDQLINTRLYQDLQVRGYTSNKFVDLPPIYTRSYIPVTDTHIPTSNSVKEIQHLQHIAPFIPPKLECDVGLLIGYDCSQALLPRRVECGEDSQPFAIETDLGWSVVGAHVQENITEVETSALLSSTCFKVKSGMKEVVVAKDVLDILNQDFKDTGRVSEIGAADVLSRNDMKFMEIVSNNIHQDEEGFYTMPLPLKGDYALPNNRWMAEQRLRCLTKRLDRDKTHSDKYRDFMKGIIDRGEAELVEKDSAGLTWYLPHHSVVHPRKPGKVRVVWDCSSKCDGVSLNDILLQGPDMNNTLLGVLLRFRLGEIAVSCDIEKMFFQFRVSQEHRDLLRYLWFDEDGKVCDYRMKVHIFGATSSPSCAIYGLRRLAKDYGEQYPQAKKFIENHFYVDDGLVSTDSADEAIEMVQQSTRMCKQANIRLCKFASTSETVMERIPLDERASEASAHEILPQISSALGVTWLIDSDEFSFRLELNDTPLSRRGILSTVSSIYDPLGLISPVLLQGKQILKQICQLGVGWDDNVPNDVRMKWQRWRTGILALADAKFPRCVKPVGFGDAVVQELHHFADASEVGYGCSSYLKQVNKDGDISCRLLMAKARVAPTKVTSIPRLELQAAVVATRLSKIMKQELVPAAQEVFYSDSEIVLGYLSNDAKRFKTYVANRVQQIRNDTDVSQWKHVKTHENPADLASRGSTVKDLMNSTWMIGPAFLHSNKHSHTETLNYDVSSDDPEVKSVVVHATSSDVPCTPMVERLKRFSNLHSAVRAIEVLQRSMRQFKQQKVTGPSVQIVRDYNKARNFVIREFQMAAYATEFEILHKREGLPKRNRLAKLQPYEDSSGMLRVGGRLAANTNLTEAVKHPIIIPRRSHLATLVIRDSHDSHHQGRGITIAKLRDKGYWIVFCTAEVKSYIYHCVTCRRLRHETLVQKMGDLPKMRIEELGPFVHTGMDCFGPFLVKNGRKQSKNYGIVFTCLSSRAVHLELLDDLSSDSFINALRCLIAVRGQVTTLVSDQGTNFKGAATELQRSLKEMADGKLKEFLSQNMIEFRFNVPSASHTGGVWERQIRTTRGILNTMLMKLTHPPDSTTMRTFLYEAMAIINGRPLTQGTLHDPMSDKPLTPNDILLMKTTVVIPPPGEFNEEYPRKRWRYVQNLAAQFWKKWRQQYIQELQARQKWLRPHRNLKSGDIVLIKEENEARGGWKTGRVEQAYPGADGLVRRVKLSMAAKLDKNGKRVGAVHMIERPIQKLILLIEAQD